MVWRFDHGEPFGGVPPDENPSGLGAFKFPLRSGGWQYADDETGELWNWMRTYSKTTGRFDQFDPIGRRGGKNGYVYVDNDPMRHVDPMGLVKWHGTFAGASAADPVGGGVFYFDLVSECKCEKRVRIFGVASALTAGLSIRPYSGSGGASEFYDYKDCPDPSIANGLFSMASASWVFGTGPGYTRFRLGGLKSYDEVDQAYGFDISIGLYLGASATIDAKIECCK